MDITVSSVSRKSQQLSDVSSSVFVISQEDIRRSGATTIPDLLRMVPGVQVASIDGSSWAVSIRGFNGTFANKLLVMIDGRTVYTPLYGGVYWDVQDTLLEDIERIEVIKGPGGTMWGANAVNGVINIITKHSQDSNGALVSGLIGSQERGTVGARFGSSVSNTTFYRLYVKHLDRDSTHSSPSLSDRMQITRGGFRIDSTPAANLSLTVQGDLYSGTADKAYTIAFPTPPYAATIPQPSDLFGSNLLTRLDWQQSTGSEFSLQLYYDRTNRDSSLIKDRRDTVDLDLQHNLHISSTHALTWGMGYRFSHDHTFGTPGVFELLPDHRSDNLVNLFAQDEITLFPDTVRLTLGAKLEHNDFTGWEVQPSARLSWRPIENTTVWAAVSRSVRTPTRSEQDSRISIAAIPANPPFAPLPTMLVVTGNRQLQAESVVAYELGVRSDLSERLALDIATFYNQYHDIADVRVGTPYVVGGTQLNVPLVLTNAHNYDSTGVEVSLQWQPTDWWKLKGGYGYITFFGDGVEQSSVVTATPAHQGTLRSMMTFAKVVDLDLWGRVVDATSAPLPTGNTSIPAYATLDARLAWRPMPGLELSLVGRNLLQQRHLEATSSQYVIRHEIERTVYGKVTWNF